MKEVIDQKLTVFIPNLIQDKPILPFLTFLDNKKKITEKKLFQAIDFSNFKDLVHISNEVAVCDVILVPHDYVFWKNNTKFVEEVFEISRIHNKKIIIFFCADSSEDVLVGNSIIVRSSKYKSTLKRNEIIMPAYSEDLSIVSDLYFKKKKLKPEIGFVGQASFRNIKHFIIHFIKNYFIFFGARKTGLYFRRKLLNMFKKNNHFISNFILRKYYSGHLKTIEGNAESFRKEYLENMKKSDFILCPKGDGNFSVRFYETLSMGRIPVLLDSDMQLPLEDIINYDNFIFRVSLKEINKTPDLLLKFWLSLSDEDFLNRQQLGQLMFKKYLFMPKFLEVLFSKKFIKQYFTYE